jgi:toxin-antitoxin system PIN domain toxin
VIVIDANILLYAHDASSPAHAAAKTWLEQAMAAEQDVRLGVATVLAFARISTDPRVYATPMAPSEAIHIVAGLLERPNVSLVNPSDRHWALFADVAAAGQARGPMLMDAHLAALAIEHGATLATTDRDFRRFAGLRLVDPTAA